MDQGANKLQPEETKPQPKPELRIPSSDKEAIELVKADPMAIQFKNSLVYIQGGTNVSLERMIARFDVVLASVFMRGVTLGLEFSKQVMDESPSKPVGGFTPVVPVLK